jgi:BirA family biotin operon repressor/biotin-[acetyl-CoA-carboxylase] ligase
VLPGGREIVGTAVSVDDQGRLRIDTRPRVAEIGDPGDQGDVVAVSAGDVVHLRPNP